LLLSGSGSRGAITSLVIILPSDGLAVGPRFEGAISHIDVLVSAVKLLGFHAAIDQPKGMDMAGDVPENGETDVDQEVATATGDEGRRCRRKDDGDKDEADV